LRQSEDQLKFIKYFQYYHINTVLKINFYSTHIYTHILIYHYILYNVVEEFFLPKLFYFVQSLLANFLLKLKTHRLMEIILRYQELHKV
jgi:hypothetical protein